jgi:hypothetical protein
LLVVLGLLGGVTVALSRRGLPASTTLLLAVLVIVVSMAVDLLAQRVLPLPAALVGGVHVVLVVAFVGWLLRPRT